MNPLKLVRAQHEHFNLGYDGPPRDLTIDEKRFRFVCMSEELSEYLIGDSTEDQYDALLDLLVFTLGTMARHGYPLEGIAAVVDSNLRKEMGPNSKRGGYELDLRKPEGWQSPDLKPFLEKAHRDNSGRA